MVAQHAKGAACANPAARKLQHRDAVGSPVDEIPQEDDATSLGVDAVPVVAKVPEQAHQRIKFTVDIADDVERAFGQGLD